MPGRRHDGRPSHRNRLRPSHNQGNAFEMHPVRNVTKKLKSIPIAAASDDGRRPESRPDLDSGEDPARPFFATDEGADLVGLELRDFESGDLLCVEPPTSARRPLEPASDGVPGNPLIRAIEEMLMPSTRRAATSSKVFRRCWRRSKVCPWSMRTSFRS